MVNFGKIYGVSWFFLAIQPEFHEYIWTAIALSERAHKCHKTNSGFWPENQIQLLMDKFFQNFNISQGY